MVLACARERAGFSCSADDSGPYHINPTIAESVTGRVTRMVIPAALLRTRFVKVMFARRIEGCRARTPGGDNSTVIVPATARHTSGSIDPTSDTRTSEQKSNRR